MYKVNRLKLLVRSTCIELIQLLSMVCLARERGYPILNASSKEFTIWFLTMRTTTHTMLTAFQFDSIHVHRVL